MISAISEKLTSFSLTREQAFKVIAVAVATLLTFGSSWVLFTTGLTLCCEGALHAGSRETWYDARALSFGKVFGGMCEIGLGNIVITVSLLVLVALGLVVMPTGPAQTALAEMALASPARFFFKAVVQAPICEEILFRGFLQERFEDVAGLFHRHICSLSKGCQQRISNLAQATLFGFAHIIGNQVAPGAKGLIAAATGWTGYVLGKRKIENNDLLLPTSIHATNNFFATISLLRRA